MGKMKCYREVEVTFENPTWISPKKWKSKDKMLMTPSALTQERKLIKQKFSPYSKIKVLRKVCNVKKWRGY